MASLGLRHAGDTPMDGFIWRKSPFVCPFGGWLRCRWPAAEQAVNGRPTGGWRGACWGGAGLPDWRAAGGVLGGGGCGAGGRWQGQGGPRDRALRAELACGDLAGGPPPTGTHTPATTTSTHNDTRPRPVSRPRPRRAQSVPLSKAAPPAIRRSCPRGPRLRRGQPRGGRRGRGRGSKTRSRHPRCGRSGSTAGRHRARHTRRA